MKLNFKEIIEGWRNHLVPPAELKDLIEEVGQHRMDICNGCPYQSERARELGLYKGYRMDIHCTQCGCPLAAKTKSLSSSCPVGKWEAITNDEDRYNIEQQIRNENNALQQGDNSSDEDTDGDISEPADL